MPADTPRLDERVAELEIRRRLVHASGSVLPALFLAGLATWVQVAALLVVGAGVAFALEALRLQVGLDWRIYDRLTREYEQNSVAGYALYMVSSALVAAGAVAGAFEPSVAAVAILMLTLGDPVSGMIHGGGGLNAIKRPRALAGMFLVCTAIAAPFFAPPVAVLGGLAGMAADGVKPVVAGFVVDDNLTIPPAAALAMQAGLGLPFVI